MTRGRTRCLQLRSGPTGAGVPGSWEHNATSRGSCRPRAKTFVNTSHRLHDLSPLWAPAPRTDGLNLDRAHPVSPAGSPSRACSGLLGSASRGLSRKAPSARVTLVGALQPRTSHPRFPRRPGSRRPLCSRGRWGLGWRRTRARPAGGSAGLSSPFPAGATLSPATPGASAAVTGATRQSQS